MSDTFDPIPSPDGQFDDRQPGETPDDPISPQGLPIEVVDAAPLRGDPPIETRSAPVIPPAVKATEGTKKKTWIIIAVVALLLICCCVGLILGGGYFLFSAPSLQDMEIPGSLLPLLAI